MLKMIEALEFWTADEIAECLPVSKSTYARLWQVLSECQKPTPLGGDGSNGMVEEPAGRLDSSNDDKTPHFWHLLTESERLEINNAFESEMKGRL